MRQDERDVEQLHAILRYCRRLDEAVARFGGDYGVFSQDTVFQDSCSLNIIRIGEAVHRLSDDFTARHPEMDWRRIYGMRCHLVHGYAMFDAEIVWDAIENCMSPLREFCEQQVGGL